MQQGHTSAAASHCPTQHSLRDLRSLHRSFWRLNPPSLDPHTAQKAKAASRLSSGQAGRAQGQFPGARCGRGLATPNDSLFLLPAPLSFRRDTDLVPAITGGLQLLGYHKLRHNCSLFSLRPGGTGLPSSAFPQPFANPRRRESTSSVIATTFFPTNICKYRH